MQKWVGNGGGWVDPHGWAGGWVWMGREVVDAQGGTSL